MKLLSAAATAVLLVSAEAFAPVLPVSGRVGTSAMQLRMAGQKVRVRSLSHVLFYNGQRTDADVCAAVLSLTQVGSVSSLPAGERLVDGDVMVVNHKNTVSLRPVRFDPGWQEQGKE